MAVQEECERKKKVSQETSKGEAISGKTQTVCAKALLRSVFGASGRCTGLPWGTERANWGNNADRHSRRCSWKPCSSSPWVIPHWCHTSLDKITQGHWSHPVFPNTWNYPWPCRAMKQAWPNLILACFVEKQSWRYKLYYTAKSTSLSFSLTLGILSVRFGQRTKRDVRGKYPDH